MTREEMMALFLLAGVEVLGAWELANQYWPSVEAYAVTRMNSPWWLVRTKAGLVEIGWRKRVISINWFDTPIRKEVTTDSVTKGETDVHAWSEAKAVEYLTVLGREINKESAA